MTLCDYCRANGAPVCAHMPGQKCDCGRPATVVVRYLPRPLPLFGGAVTAAVCSPCYPVTGKRGTILHEQAVEAA